MTRALLALIVIAALGPVRAQTLVPASTQVPVCGFTLNTTTYYTPSGAMPTIWAPVDEPVFVRLYVTRPNLAWTVRQVSDREIGASGVARIEEAAVIRQQRGVAQRVASSTEPGKNVPGGCAATAFYQDILLDEAEANRSRVYGLDVQLAETPAGLRDGAGTADTASYYFNVRRYRPVYAEASIGPIVSTSRTVTHTADQFTVEGEPRVVLNETEQGGRVEVAAGALLRPWGYNPLASPHGWGKLRSLALYAATPLSGRFLESLYAGVGWGARGITVVGGVHVYERTTPLDGVTVGVPQAAPAWLDEADELTRRDVHAAAFVGIQLNSSLFGSFFGQSSRNESP